MTHNWEAYKKHPISAAYEHVVTVRGNLATTPEEALRYSKLVFLEEGQDWIIVKNNLCWRLKIKTPPVELIIERL